MNFLQLCQRAAVECGVASGSAIKTVLPTTVGATGALGRIVNWVNDAWTDVQMDNDEWEWMRASSLLGSGVAFQTIAGKYSYPLAGTASGGDFSSDFSSDFATTGGVATDGTVGIAVDSFGKWDRDTFRCFTTAASTGVGDFSSDFSSDFSTGSVSTGSSGDFSSDFNSDFSTAGSAVAVTGGGFNDEMFLDEIPYDAWRNGYMLGAMRRVQTRPYVIAVGPNQSLCLGPPPNGLYTITGDYWVAPSEMINDTDIPAGLPTRFQMLIVYRTMMKYAGYESAPEVYERGSQENAGMYAQLLAVRAPRMSWAGALA
jgi:hypothetical protein